MIGYKETYDAAIWEPSDAMKAEVARWESKGYQAEWLETDSVFLTIDGQHVASINEWQNEATGEVIQAIEFQIIETVKIA